MAKNNEIHYGIVFDIDKRKLQTLKTELENISKIEVGDVMASTGKNRQQAQKDLIEVRSIARNVEEALQKAYNPKLNTTNIQKFKQELGLTGQSLNSLKQTFAKIGPQGELAFARIQGEVYKLGNATRQTSKTLQKMGTTLANTIKWTVSSSLVNQFTGSIQQAWGFAKALDGSLNDIRIVTGKSRQEMAKFAESANKAAQGLGRTTTDYTKAALIYAQQGLGDEQVAARTEVTLKTANVTGQSAEQVSEELTAVWNGYRVSAEEAELYIDRLAAIAATTASDLQELSTGMSKVAAAAASLGVGEDQLAAQLSTIISATRQAPETVGTALKTVYARITDIKSGIDEDGTTLGMYSNKLAEVGINVLDTAGNLRNMGEVIEEIGGKWGQYTKEQQIYIAQTMAGQRQYSNLIALFQNFDKYNEAMKVSGNAAGTLQKQQETYLDSIEAHTNQLTASMENMWKSMIDSESMKSLIDFLNVLIKNVTGLIDSLGGGGNVLLMLGTIATTVFQKNMTAGLSKTLYNLTQVKAATLDYKTKIADINIELSKLGKDDVAGREYYENLKKIYDLGKTGNIIPKEQYDNLVRINQELRETYALLKAAKQKNTQAESNFEMFNVENPDAASSGEEGQGQEKSSNWQSFLQSYSSNSKSDKEGKTYASRIYLAIDQTKAAYSEYQKVLGEIKTNIGNQKEETQRRVNQGQYINKLLPENNIFKGVRENVAKVSNNRNYNQATKTSIQNYVKMKTWIEKVQQAQKKMNVLSEEQVKKLEKVKAALKAVEDTLATGGKGKGAGTSSNIVNKVKDASDAYKEFGKTAQDALAKVQGVEKDIDQSLSGEREAPNIQQKAENLEEEFEHAFSKTRFAAVANGITSITTGLAQAFNIAQQIRNIGGLLGEETVDGGQIAISAVTTLGAALPSLIENIKAFSAARKLQKTTTEEATTATNANTGAVGLNTAATNAGKTSVISFLTAAAPMIAIISMTVGLIGGIIGAIDQYHKKQKEIAEERAKASIEENKRISDELKNREKLYKSLQELNQQYKKGTISKEEISSKTQELCKEYDLQLQKVKSLIAGYNDLDEAIAVARAADQEREKMAQSAILTTSSQLLLDSQRDQKIGNQGYSYGDYVSNFTPEQLRVLQKHGFEIDQQGLKISLTGSQKNKYSVGEINKKFQEALNDMQSQDMAQGAGYENLYRDYKWAAEDNHIEDVIKSYNNSMNATILDLLSKNGINKVSSSVGYNAVLDSVTEALKQGGYAQSLSPEEIQKRIEENIKDSNFKVFQNYANQADIARKYEDVVKDHERQLDQFTHISLEDIAYIDPKDVEKWDQFYQILKKIEEKKQQSTPSTIGINEATEAYEKYVNVLSKARKGQKLSKTEFEELDEDLQAFYTRVGNQYLMNYDLEDFVAAIQNKEIKSYGDNIKNLQVQKENFTNRLGISYSSSLDGYRREVIQSDNAEADTLKRVRQSLLPSQVKISKTELNTKEGKNKNLEAIKEAYSYLNTNDELINSDNGIIKDALQTIKSITEKTATDFSQEDINTYEQALTNILTESAQKGIVSERVLDQDEIQNMMEFLQDSGEMSLPKEQKKKINDKNFNPNDEDTKRIVKNIQDAYRNVRGEDYSHSAITQKINETNKDIEENARLLHEGLFATDEDLEDTAIYALNKTIRDAAKNSQILSENLIKDKQSAQDLAEEVLRFDNGVQDVAENIGSWSQSLKDGTLTDLQNIRDAYGDIFDIQEEALSTEFLSNQNNLQLLQDAIKGNEESSYESYLELQRRIQEEIFNRHPEFYTQYFQKQAEQLKNEIKDLKIGDSIESSFVDSMIKILSDARFTKDEINNIFKGMRIDVDLITLSSGEIVRAMGSTATVGADYAFKLKQLSSAAQDAVKKIKSEVQLKELAKDQRDFYHDINIELEEINNQLSRAEKISKRLYGKDLIDNLNKQQDILNKEIGALKTKQQIQKQDLNFRAQQLANLGVNIGGNGQITNYMQAMTDAQNALDAATNQYNILAQEYNKSQNDSLKSQMDEVNKEISKRSTALSDLKTAISEYDSLRKDFEQISDKIDDTTQKIFEINIQKFKMEAELRLDLGEAERQWNEFKRNVLDRDNVILTTSFQKVNKDARQNLGNAQSYFNSGELNANTQQLSRIMQAINNINKNGIDEIYGDNKAQAIEDGKAAQKQLMEELKSIEDALDGIDQAYLDTIDNIHQMYSLQQQAYQTYGEQLSHDLDLIKLLYGEKNYNAMDKYFKKIQTNNVNQLDFLKRTKQENYQQLQLAEARAAQAARENGEDSQLAKKLAADAQKFREAYLQNISDINSLISESVQNLQDQYSNSINKIFEDIEHKMTNNKGFDYLDTQWELMKKNSDLYLDEVNSAFAIKNTQFMFEKALNDAKGLKSQQQLRTAMDEQLQILREKDKLTQYDVDRASKILEIEKARIALEEAQNNKTSMRLKRDSQGNYSYEFTADQDQVNEAESKLAQAENDLYNFDKDQTEKVLKDAYDSVKEYWQARTELELQYVNASPKRQEEINKKLKLMAQQYNNYIREISKQTSSVQKNLLDSAINSYSNSYNTNLENFNRMSDEQKKKWLEDMVPALKSGIADLVGSFATNPDSFKNMVQSATNEMDNERKKYQAGLKQLEDAADVNFSNIQKGIDKTTTKTKELIVSNDELLDKMDKEHDKIEKLREKGEELREKYDAVRIAAKNAVGEFQKLWGTEQVSAIDAAAKAVNKVAEAYNNVGDSMVNFERTSAGLGNFFVETGESMLDAVQRLLAANKTNSNGLTSVQQDILVRGINVLRKKEKEFNQNHFEGGPSGSGILKDALSAFYSKWRANGFSDKAVLTEAGIDSNLFKHILEIVFENNKDKTKRIVSLDSGGYTGNWDSKQGRLALLHEKELVLNQEDTKNMLKMLEISREMTDLVQSNILSILNTQSQKLNTSKQNVSQQLDRYERQKSNSQSQVEQDIKIEATFPNVNSKKEIEEAFSNLVNIATQRALQNNQ